MTDRVSAAHAWRHNRRMHTVCGWRSRRSQHNRPGHTSTLTRMTHGRCMCGTRQTRWCGHSCNHPIPRKPCVHRTHPAAPHTPRPGLVTDKANPPRDTPPLPALHTGCNNHLPYPTTSPPHLRVQNGPVKCKAGLNTRKDCCRKLQGDKITRRRHTLPSHT